MELSGNLKKFPLPKVLQFLNMDQATGELRLIKGKRQIVLTLEDGNVADVSDTARSISQRMKEIVLASGKMQENEWDIITEEVKTRLTPVGKVLTDSNYLSHRELQRLLKRVYFETLLEALNLSDGTYEFEHKDEILAQGELPDPISVNSLMLNMARQEDEWADLHKVVPTREAVFGRPETVAEETWESVLSAMSPDDQRIARTIDGYSTAGMVADITFATDFDVANTINELVRRGLLVRALDQEAAYVKSKPKTFFSINIGPMAQRITYFIIVLILLVLFWGKGVGPIVANWEENKTVIETAGLEPSTANRLRLMRIQNAFYAYLKEQGEPPASLQQLVRQEYTSASDLDIIGGGHFELKVIGLQEEVAILEGIDSNGTPIESLTLPLMIR